MKKFHKSQRDPNPSRRVNPGLEKGYPAKRVDLGWLLQSCKYLLQIDRTRVDPLRRVEANPGSCKGGLGLFRSSENWILNAVIISNSNPALNTFWFNLLRLHVYLGKSGNIYHNI